MTRARTYLDHNASVPLRAEARAAMLMALDTEGNPSSVHAEGRRARGIVEQAREHVACLVNANPSEVVFTSGATEANAWVMSAGWEAICVSGIEHDSVLAPARRVGATLVELEASTDGAVDVKAAREQIVRVAQGSGRVLLSLMMANNETGVVQPVAEAAQLAREYGVAIHVDAVQAPGRIAVDFAALGLDVLVLSAHKLGGPHGVGALIIRDGLSLPAFITGGGQERQRRGGTENVAGIAGFGAVADAISREQEVAAHTARLRAKLEDGIRQTTPDALIIGNRVERLPNTSCIALPGKPAETMVIKLDLEGVAVSAGSACSSGKVGTSHVLEAMGLAPEIARSAIRVSLGPQTLDEDIAAFLAAWEKISGPAAVAA